MSGPREDVCEWCGKVKPDVETCDDPFLAEVYQESCSLDICRDCFNLRADDI